jgi:signal transduction histidine kinase
MPAADDKTLPTRFVRNAVTVLQANKPGAAVSEFYHYSLIKPHGADSEQEVLEYVRGLRISGQCAACHVGSNAARPFQNDELVGLIYVRVPSEEQPLIWRISMNLAVAIGSGVIAVILAVIVFYVIIKSLVLSPVRKLRRLADHIGEGDLSVRSTINTGDEFERLSKAFNSMLERLQVSQQQMRQINESLNSKMDELAKANVALFESNRLKSEFLARVSHELRTPLNSIIGFAEVLRDQMAETLAAAPDDAQAAKAARYADNILTSGRMLLELINDLLDLSKIEAGKMVVRYEKVVIADLVEAVIRFMRPAADKKNLQVTVTVDPELPLVQTDGGKLQQILYNLFSNAVKFTPPRGSVSVCATRAGDELVIAVSDTGPGIPPEDQQAIFEKFHQLDSPVTREHGGTGLGLAISQELAAMLGGRISLVSKLGEGSTFSVTLPLQLPAGPAEK